VFTPPPQHLDWIQFVMKLWIKPTQIPSFFEVFLYEWFFVKEVLLVGEHMSHAAQYTLRIRFRRQLPLPLDVIIRNIILMIALCLHKSCNHILLFLRLFQAGHKVFTFFLPPAASDNEYKTDTHSRRTCRSPFGFLHNFGSR
jgi:hypothetical protein